MFSFSCVQLFIITIYIYIYTHNYVVCVDVYVYKYVVYPPLLEPTDGHDSGAGSFLQQQPLWRLYSAFACMN